MWFVGIGCRRSRDAMGNRSICFYGGQKIAYYPSGSKISFLSCRGGDYVETMIWKRATGCIAIRVRDRAESQNESLNRARIFHPEKNIIHCFEKMCCTLRVVLFACSRCFAKVVLQTL